MISSDGHVQQMVPVRAVIFRLILHAVWCVLVPAGLCISTHCIICSLVVLMRVLIQYMQVSRRWNCYIFTTVVPLLSSGAIQGTSPH